MGKVIDFESHFIKEYQMTVKQLLVMRPYIKWNVRRQRLWNSWAIAQNRST